MSSTSRITAIDTNETSNAIHLIAFCSTSYYLILLSLHILELFNVSQDLSFALLASLSRLRFTSFKLILKLLYKLFLRCQFLSILRLLLSHLNEELLLVVVFLLQLKQLLLKMNLHIVHRIPSTFPAGCTISIV